MQAIKSTHECYLRSKVWTNLDVTNCDPLGDQNVYGTLFEHDRNKHFVMVASKVLMCMVEGCGYYLEGCGYSLEGCGYCFSL